MFVKIVWLYFVLSFSVEGLKWTSHSSLPDGVSMTVCVDQNVTIAWTFAGAAEEHLMDVEWYFKADGKSETLVATKTAGFFLKAPTAPQTFSFMPNAGLQLFNVQPSHAGRYSVKVNMNVHGSVVTSTQTLNLSVSDTKCQTGDQRVSELKAQVNQLQSENVFLTSRLERLEQFPAIKDFMDRPATCVDVRKYDGNSGVHTLHMADGTSIPVYCQQSDSDAWTVIQRRFDGSIEFFHTWRDYEDGFGSLYGEFWLGLENLHRLTKERPNMLRVELEGFDNKTAFAEYRNFSVASWESGYTLTLGDYNGTAGDSMADNNGAKFSTLDKENDVWSIGKCADYHHAGWWFRQCTKANLNAAYKPTNSSGDNSIFWDTFKENNVALKRVEMKMKPV